MTRPPIEFARRDARQGIEWLKHAARMFKRNPLAWLLLLFTYYLLVGLAELGPWARIGQFVAPILKPVFAVGFLAAAWTQERGGSPKFEHLFRGFRSNLYALIPLGIVFLAGMTLAVLATVLVDGGKLIGLLSGAEKPTEETMLGGQLQLAMLFGGVCALPTLFALWLRPRWSCSRTGDVLRPEDEFPCGDLPTGARWRRGSLVFAFGGVLRAGAVDRSDAGRYGGRHVGAVRGPALSFRLHRDAAHIRLRQLTAMCSTRMNRYRRSHAWKVMPRRAPPRGLKPAYSSASNARLAEVHLTRASLPRRGIDDDTQTEPRVLDALANSPARVCMSFAAGNCDRPRVELPGVASRSRRQPLQGTRWKFIQKSRCNVVPELAVQHSALRVSQVEPSPCTSHGNVGEAPLLLQPVVLGKAVFVREQALFEARDKYGVELQALGGMYRHQL